MLCVQVKKHDVLQMAMVGKVLVELLEVVELVEVVELLEVAELVQVVKLEVEQQLCLLELHEVLVLLVRYCYP